ncbi:phytochrome-like protein cph1 [mine drainage metagenome]|uniref:histidine kinase n=1 Tax=mine drainage metagenome TaxID=410659 RepID=A0A1J5S830_9ZZZZ
MVCEQSHGLSEDSGGDFRQGAARLEAVVDELGAYVFTKDRAGRYTYANRLVRQLFGRPLQDIIGHDDSHFFDLQRSRDLCRNDRMVLEAGRIIAGEEANHVAASGERRVYWTVKKPLYGSGGAIIGLIGISTDITERKALEMELERSNQELEQFAYVVSHDLRQPLRMVLSYLSLIARRLDGRLDAEDRELIGYALDGARRLDALILGLLDYARVGRGGLAGTVALDEVIAEALGNLHLSVQEAGAVVEVAPAFPVVRADRTEMMRLFQNLVGNALKYRDPHRPCRVRLGWSREDGLWRLMVADNGIGIAARDQERAFVLFQRLVPEDRCEGTGIGLAVCRKIVERAGGRIWIDSEPGLGATFHFTLPVLS